MDCVNLGRAFVVLARVWALLFVVLVVVAICLLPKGSGESG